jgi:hypothetical protein
MVNAQQAIKDMSVMITAAVHIASQPHACIHITAIIEHSIHSNSGAAQSAFEHGSQCIYLFSFHFILAAVAVHCCCSLLVLLLTAALSCCSASAQ